MRSRLVSQLLYPLAGVALIIAVWVLACWFFNIPTVVLPSPDKVLRSLIVRSDLLFSEGWITLKETLYGFVLALVVGLPLAVAIANSRPLNLMFYPLLIALQSVPKVALAPMILVWLGTGLESKLAIVWLVAFFPIIVDTAAGLRATPKELLELAHSLNASPLQIFVKVQLPAALPFIVTGAKVAITLAVIGAVIGEFIGSSEGLGFLLLSATSQLDTPLAFAALFPLITSSPVFDIPDPLRLVLGIAPFTGLLGFLTPMLVDRCSGGDPGGIAAGQEIHRPPDR